MDEFIHQISQFKLNKLFDSTDIQNDLSKCEFKIVFIVPYNFGMFQVCGGIFFLENEIQKRLPNVIVDTFFYYDFMFDHQGNLKDDIESVETLYSYKYHFDLKKVDMLAFSFPNTINYYHILNIFNYLRIPFKTSARKNFDYPLIVLGNNALTNPEPFAEVIDVFCVGFVIEEFIKFIQQLTDYKKYSKDKLGFINHFGSSYKNIILFHNRDYTNQTKYKLGEDYKINTNPLLSISPVMVDNKVYLTPNLGCKKTCSFCQFAYTRYYEFDFNAIKPYILLAKEKGAKTVVINSLSFTQHSQRYQILDFLKQHNLKCIVGSSRPDEMDDDYLNKLGDVIENNLYSEMSGFGKKRILTLAVETPSDEILKILRKQYTHESIEQAVKMGIKNGYDELCLYFMVGLPHDEDLKHCYKIVDFVFELFIKYASELKHIMIKVMQFVPLAQTDFQRTTMADPSVTENNVMLMKKYLNAMLGEQYQARIDIHYEGTNRYYYEVITSRGGKEVGAALIEMFNQNISPYNIKDKLDAVINIFKSLGLDYLSYYNAISLDQPVPWEQVNIVNKRIEKMAEKNFNRTKTNTCKDNNTCHEKNSHNSVNEEMQ